MDIDGPTTTPPTTKVNHLAGAENPVVGPEGALRVCVAQAVCVLALALLAGCASADPPSANGEAQGPSETAFGEAWALYFAEEDLPFEGVENCAASAAVAAIGPDRLQAAQLSPEDISVGASPASTSPSQAELDQFADRLQDCGLRAPYRTALGSIMPFVPEAEAGCVAAEIADYPDYADGLARWVFLRDSIDWLEAVRPAFDRALVGCPAAYGSIAVGGIELRVGSVPRDGAKCLESAFADHVEELLVGGSADSSVVVRSIVQSCESMLGAVAATILESL
jgi:hypothetical protein